MGPLLAAPLVTKAGMVAAAGVIYGLGHLIGIFHGRRIEQKLNAAAKKVISTAAQ